MSVAWKDYLAVDSPRTACTQCRQHGGAVFAQQRARILRVLEETRPNVVACLGAGALNDIPYTHLVEAGTELHLVDWIPNLIEAAVEASTLNRDDAGQPCCVYCHPSVEYPQQYCTNFRPPSGADATVCGHFQSCPDDPRRCAAFCLAEQLSIHAEDVTGGYATHFGEQLIDQLRGIRSWKQAFARATSLAEQVARHPTALSIPDDHVDLVTSSMVISQFDHEPFGYFARRVTDSIGPPTKSEERRLTATTDALRSALLTKQLDRHFNEILRILAPKGRCYMSFELFHVAPTADRWFAVGGMASALEMLGRHFLFDFSILPESECLTRFQNGPNPSLVLSLVLEPTPQ